MTRTRRPFAAAITLTLSLLAFLGVTAAPAHADSVSAVPPISATTTAVEATRVDRVAKKTTIHWKAAAGGGYSARVTVPLDYDHPRGKKIRVAVFKVPAANPSAKIGTLFINPGGPGASGVALAQSLLSSPFLSADVLARFDIVGFDPRGTNNSTRVRCFSSTSKQRSQLTGMTAEFPIGSAQEKRFLKATKNEARGCSSYGKSLASAMSTAEVARDMEVLRQAVGDSKLNYLGFSYGTYLGEVYASLFPDRFRAMALDGVIDPTAWSGSNGAYNPTSARIRAAAGAWKALQQGFTLCQQAGTSYCPLTDPMASFQRVAATLLDEGEVYLSTSDGVISFTYQDYIGIVLGALYYPDERDANNSPIPTSGRGMSYIVELTRELDAALNGTSTQALKHARTAGSLVRAYRTANAPLASSGYDNDLDAYSGVICTDGYQPSKPSKWISAANAADKYSPYFGRIWVWSDAQCASKYWKAKDEDRYRGSFTKPTASPVLIVGNYWDPATNYDSAVSTKALMPNSYLISSNSWGHTAYGTSACVTGRMDAYLVSLTAPAAEACTGDVQPFATTWPTAGSVTTAGSSANELVRQNNLPPIVEP